MTPMIRRENRQSIQGAFLDIHRQNPGTMNDYDILTRYPIENISRGGLRFLCHDQFNIDERIQITVHMANGETHSARARICYCDLNNTHNGDCHYGVSFLDNFLEMALCL